MTAAPQITGALTLRTVYAIAAPTSGGRMWAVSGKNKAAKVALADRYGRPSPGGFHIISETAFHDLVAALGGAP